MDDLSFGSIEKCRGGDPFLYVCRLFSIESRGQTCEIFKEVDIMLTGYPSQMQKLYPSPIGKLLVIFLFCFSFFHFGHIQVFSHFLVFEVIRLEAEEDG